MPKYRVSWSYSGVIEADDIDVARSGAQEQFDQLIKNREFMVQKSVSFSVEPLAPDPD